VDIKGISADRLAAYEDTGLTPSEVAELAKAKQEGRLVNVVRCSKCAKWADCRIQKMWRTPNDFYCADGEPAEAEKERVENDNQCKY